MRSSPRPRRRRRRFAFTRPGVALAGALALTLVGQAARAQTTYNYTGPVSTTVGGSLWSTAANWTPGTGYPGSNGITTTDQANLTDTTANRIVTYDAAASGYLGALNITETSGFTNEVVFIGSANVNTAGAATVAIKTGITLGASNGGTSTLFVDSFSGSANNGTATSGGTVLTVTAPTLTLNSGGVLELFSGASSTTAITSATLNATVTLQGGTINADRGAASASAGSAITTIGGTLIMTSGTINLSAANSLGVAASTGTNDNRLYTGNFQATGGTINQQLGGTSSAASTTLQLSEIFMQGATNFMTSGVTFNTGTTMQVISGGAQAFYCGDTLNVLALRTASNSTATPTNQAIGVKTIGAATSTGTVNASGNLIVGQISFTDSPSNQFNGTTLKLASNISSGVAAGGNPNYAAGALFPIHNSATAATETIDTASFTLDLTNVSTATTNNGGIYAPVNIVSANGGFATSGVTTFVLTNSTANGGTIKAPGFDLSQGSTGSITVTGATGSPFTVSGGVNVTGNVTLNATGGPATASKLDGFNVGATTGTITNLAATSTFLYSGTGTATSPATLTATNRTIGMLAVSAGFLQVNPGGAAALTTGGAVTVTGGGLDLSGTSFGALTLNAGNFSLSNATLVLTLSGGFDVVNAAGSGQSFALTNATIALNGTNSGTSYQVFNNFTGANTVTNVTFTNVPAGQTASIDTTGLITFSATAVPEPGTWVGGLLLVGALGLWGRRRKHASDSI